MQIPPNIRGVGAVGSENQPEPLYDLIHKSGFEIVLPDKITPDIGLFFTSLLRILFYKILTSIDKQILSISLSLTDQLLEKALKGQYIQLAVETLLLRAQIASASGDERNSSQDYSRALDLGESEGYISLFLEEGMPVAQALTFLQNENQNGTNRTKYIQQILNAFSKFLPQNQIKGEVSKKVDLEFIIEPLTDRELEVLHLIADGLKYEEIGGHLFISLNTVRTYVKRIYGKLNVNNRTKAIALARQLNII
jgi:LuxR family transcriptional regulator, maltose regulon positive regulatory protein